MNEKKHLKAVALFDAKDENSSGPLEGFITFYQIDRLAPVLVDVSLYDPSGTVTDGLHGFHIHAK
jgi:Cu/Zn superoxide dismutase